MSMIIKPVNQVITFLLEIAMLVIYGSYGLSMPWNLISRILFTILLVSSAIIVWSVFAAPKSARRLEMPYLAIFRASMFFVAFIFLFQLGYTNTAIVLTGLTIATQTISYFTEK